MTPEALVSLKFLGAQSLPGGTTAIPGASWAARIAGLDPKISGGWTIFAAGAHQPIGLIVYHRVETSPAAAIISYGLEQEARGAGLAGEAVASATKHLLKVVGFETVFADVELVNVASQRMLQKVGFEPVTAGNTPGVDVAQGRPAQRWVIGVQQCAKERSVIDQGSTGAASGPRS